jgi:hypothetical protein
MAKLLLHTKIQMFMSFDHRITLYNVRNSLKDYVYTEDYKKPTVHFEGGVLDAVIDYRFPWLMLPNFRIIQMA